MSQPCCAKDCLEQATIREPLIFDDLVLHVPLCPTHNQAWTDFAVRREKAMKKLAKDAKSAGLLLDLALTYGAFPPGHHT